MREILFRGKTDKGEWVYGYYVETLRYNNLHWIWDGKEYVKIDPETIGQYTGLTDKNGNKIFEGDILKSSWETILTIFYDEISSSYRVKTSTGHEREPSYYGIDKWEVIGNIHDNPKLLKGCEG